MAELHEGKDITLVYGEHVGGRRQARNPTDKREFDFLRLVRRTKVRFVFFTMTSSR